MKQTDVMKHWDKVRQCIEYVLTLSFVEDDTVKTIATIKKAIMVDQIQVWMLTDEVNEIKALMITLPKNINFSSKSLHIFALMAFAHITDDEYKDSFTKISEYAKDKGYKYITAESANDRIIDIFKRLGGKGFSLNLYWEVI